MFRWCAFCQKSMGETEPLENLSLTHGVCAECAPAARKWDAEDQKRVQPLVDFYSRLRNLAHKGELPPAKALLEESRRLKIQPVDFVLGLLQPVLYEIGELWRTKQTTVAREHLFTSLVSEILSELRAEGALPRPSYLPRVFLATVDGNYHVLGVQMLELSLALAGIPSLVVYPGLPPSEVESIVRDLSPAFLGLSVSMAEQWPVVDETCHRIMGIEPQKRPRILVGGLAVRSRAERKLPYPIETLPDAGALIHRVA